MDLTLCSAAEECIHSGFCLRSTLKEKTKSNKQSWCDFKKMGCAEESDYDCFVDIGFIERTGEV